MKKISTLFIKRLLPILIFLIAQVRAWASDTTTATSIDRGHNIFSQPWIWIFFAVLTTLILLGPLTNDSEKFVIIRKKQLQGKERNNDTKD